MERVLMVLLIINVKRFSEGKTRFCDLVEDEDVGRPLLLTPYLDEGGSERAREAARVRPLVGNVESYSGFFTVDEQHRSNMFFWYFPAESFAEAPVILWLQGGPGLSSLVGLFLEHGPYNYVGGGLQLRSYSWSKKFHMIYVDNPVGTGFSYTSPSGMCRNETCVGLNLYRFVVQFYTMFSDLKRNDFYIAGQSYGCKFVATLAYKIHSESLSGTDDINLKGMAIGNGLCDPINMIDTSEYLYQIGLVDDADKRRYKQAAAQVTRLIEDEKWSLAFDSAYRMISTDPMVLSLFQNVTGFTSCFNILVSVYDTSRDNWQRLVEDRSTRKIIHVGDLKFQPFFSVFTALKDDFMQSVSPWLGRLAEVYKVLIYSGQLDIIIPYTSTINFVKNLPWVGSRSYKSARRRIWKDSDGHLAGYVKVSSANCSSGVLTEVMVRNAGHVVTVDQPKWAFEMISNFVYELEPFT